MGRRPCCAKDAGLNRGAWTAHEDKLLADYIQVHGDGKWRDLPQKAGELSMRVSTNSFTFLVWVSLLKKIHI